MASPNEELLEPFRPQRRKLTASKEDNNSFLGMNFSLRQLPQISTTDFSDSFNSFDSDSSDRAIEEVNEFHQTLIEIISDDNEFRRLKKDMRKRHRSGFAQQQAVYSMVMENNSRRRHRLKGNAMLMLKQANMTGNGTLIDRRKLMEGSKKSPDEYLPKMNLLSNQEPASRQRIKIARCA